MLYVKPTTVAEFEGRWSIQVLPQLLVGNLLIHIQ